MATTSPSARKVSPTLFADDHFGAPGNTWQPDRGLRLDYNRFVDILSRLTPDVQISDPVGPAAKVGMSYAVNREWSVIASVSAIKTKSDVLAAGSSVLTTTIDFHPVAYSIDAAYRF